MALKLEQTMEGEWRLGCPVEHHKQGVHSYIKDLNWVLNEVEIPGKKARRVSTDIESQRPDRNKYLKLADKICIFYWPVTEISETSRWNLHILNRHSEWKLWSYQIKCASFMGNYEGIIKTSRLWT